jgi:hypothetical protein
MLQEISVSWYVMYFASYIITYLEFPLSQDAVILAMLGIEFCGVYNIMVS